jgi:predicted enzyme related to lactoylglutathione lyase
MVTRDTPWPNGTPCWVDLGVDDPDAGRLFYEGLFGWQIEAGPPEAGGYMMCLKNGRPAAGLGPKMSPDQPSFWTTYLAADDLDDVVGKVRANGGQVLMEPMDVMGVGRMAIAVDPGGAVFGVWQALTHHGAAVVNEPGAVIWNENMSRAWQADKDFYAAVFGWEYGEMSADGFKYATFKVSGADVGGIGELAPDSPADMPASWTTYFAVESTDESVDELVKLGGNVIRPAWDTPFGRMAVVSDNQGAVFALMSAPAEGYEAAGDAGS